MLAKTYFHLDVHQCSRYMSVHYWWIPCDRFKWNALSLDPLKSAMRVAVVMTQSCCIVVYGSAFCVHTSRLASSVKIKGLRLRRSV